MNRRVFPRESNSMCGLKGKKNGGDARYLNAVMEYLDSRVNTQGTALEILAEDRVLYSTLDFKQPVTVKANYIGRMAEYSRQEIDGKEYLILSSFFPLKDTRIRNLFFVDISGIYAVSMRIGRSSMPFSSGLPP